MIKIITTKKWKQMIADLEEANKNLLDVRSAVTGLHELMKGQYNKYSLELGQKDDTISERDAEIEKLKKDLRKSEHDRMTLFKKLKKYESRRE